MIPDVKTGAAAAELLWLRLRPMFIPQSIPSTDLPAANPFPLSSTGMKGFFRAKMDAEEQEEFLVHFKWLISETAFSQTPISCARKRRLGRFQP